MSYILKNTEQDASLDLCLVDGTKVGSIKVDTEKGRILYSTS